MSIYLSTGINLPSGLSSTYPGWKQSKVEYLLLLADFDCLKIGNYYDTIEISVLGHYQPSTVKNLLKLLAFANPVPRSVVKDCLDSAAAASISALQRIFLARNCKEWGYQLDCVIYFL